MKVRNVPGNEETAKKHNAVVEPGRGRWYVKCRGVLFDSAREAEIEADRNCTNPHCAAPASSGTPMAA